MKCMKKEEEGFDRKRKVRNCNYKRILPEQMSDDEVTKACNQAISDSSAQSIKDMGKVMTVLKSKYLGKMDFAKAGKILKEQLQG